MKKITLLFLAILLVCSLCAFSACGTDGETLNNEPGQTPTLKDFTNITFNDVSVEYDGEQHILGDVLGAPEGTDISYTNRVAQTDCGTYVSTATLSLEGYNTKTVSATLTITGANFTGTVFNNNSITYDGAPHTILASCDQSNTTITYSNEGPYTDTGTYTITATLTKTGYNTKTLTATLNILKADITGITMEETQSTVEDKSFHFPEYKGSLPNGVSIKWIIDNEENSVGVKEVGNYAVKLVLSGKNYNELILNTAYKIKLNLINFAKTIIDTFGEVPDPWSFLPDKFNVENKTVDQSKIPTFVEDTNVSDIPKNYIGAQLNVVYTILNKLSTGLKTVSTVYKALNTIQTAYQAYLNTDPDNYKVFENNEGAFTYKIVIDDKKYSINASISGVSVEIFSDIENHNNGAKIALGNNNIVKYTSTDDTLLIALDIADISTSQIEFVRDKNGNVVGYLYEYLYLKDKQVQSTSALLTVGENYTTIVGTKGDFILTADGRNCEVYSNTTGYLVGTEVKENVEKADKYYNTFWFNLYDVSGISKIRKEDKKNYNNPDTIYINGNKDTIHTMTVNFPFDLSRRFDIEFKTVYCFVADENGNYDKVSFEVPLLFIQDTTAKKDKIDVPLIDSFSEDFKKENDVDVILNVSDNNKQAIYYGYYTLVNTYDTIKNLVTHQSILDYCKD